MNGLVVDLFAGGGGASTGLEAALGRPVDIALNHDPVALAAHKANHPHTRHLEADIWSVSPQEATGGQPVAILWASPDCTHFSVAKGGKPRKQKIRSLAWAVVRWAAAVEPQVILLENVSEFRGWGPLDGDGRPIKARMGETFRRWKRKLEALGYEVDLRILDASLYGAPTRRRRLFIVARRDGLAIRWPEPTHGPGRKPVHTAAECIDWAIPCPSIFERKKPLAEKTLWRIAQGIRRFVLENPRPYIVRTDHHQSHATNAFPLDLPLSTITSAQGHAVAVPSLVQMSHGEGAGKTKRRGRPAHPLSEPLPTQSASNDFGLLVPSLIEMNHSNAPHGVDEPAGVVTTQHNRLNLVAPVLATIDQQGAGDGATTSADAPVPTMVTKNRHVLVAPSLVQTGYGEREGQAPRALDIEKPLGTVIAGGSGGNGKHALVAGFLAKHFGGVVGHQLELPTGTITTIDHHSLAAAALVKFNGNAANGHPGAGSVDEPMPTTTAQGNHVAEVRAFLTAFYGRTDGKADVGQGVLDGMRTITSKHRLGLVTVEGVDYQIVDIGMRMLEPHELLRAQFGRFAAGYDLSAAKTKSSKVRLIGNSVCPEVAEAVARANVRPADAEAAA